MESIEANKGRLHETMSKTESGRSEGTGRTSADLRTITAIEALLQ